MITESRKGKFFQPEGNFPIIGHLNTTTVKLAKWNVKCLKRTNWPIDLHLGLTEFKFSSWNHILVFLMIFSGTLERFFLPHILLNRIFYCSLYGNRASCTMGTGSFPGVRAAGAWSWLLIPSIAMVKKEYSYTSTPLWFISPVQSLSACTSVHFSFYLYLYCVRHEKI